MSGAARFGMDWEFLFALCYGRLGVCSFVVVGVCCFVVVGVCSFVVVRVCNVHPLCICGMLLIYAA